ncbi:MAG: hypothetical protein ACC682_15470 [Gemmatimonadota bacterium]
MNDAQQPRTAGGGWARWLLIAMVGVLALYVVWLVLFYRYHFVDGVNLLIHEAGHVIFIPFGITMGVLGGTILQLAFPIFFVAYFARRRQTLEAGFCTIWAAESLMYTAAYMADANMKELTLLGGHIHDWNYLFERAGLLGAAEEIASTLHFLASLAAVLAVYVVFQAVLKRSS